MATPAAPTVSNPPTGATAAAPQLVSPESTSFDLDAHRAARAKGPAAPVDDATPDPDVEGDPELAAEIDALEKPPAEETPQQKAARTRKYKEAAGKSQKTRYKNQRDEARTQLAEREREIEEWRTGKRTHQAPAPAATSAPAAGALKPSTATDDPKPTLKDFPLEKFKDEEDPYEARSAALAEAVARWGTRDEHRKQEEAQRETRQREEAERDEDTAARTFNERVEQAKPRYSDFDAVVGAYTLPKEHPLSRSLFTLVTRSDVGPDIAYHLGKNRDVLERLMRSRDEDALKEAFYEVRADVKAAMKGNAPATPPKVHPAQEPAQPVNAGAGSGAVLRNPLQDSGTAVDLDEVRAFRKRR
jgi:hypothetical protein